MSDNKNRSKKNKKHKIHCIKCQFYDKQFDYCSEKDIEDCSKQSHINFSSCDSFLVKEELMFFWGEIYEWNRKKDDAWYDRYS